MEKTGQSKSKLEFYKDVIRTVKELCQVVFNITSDDKMKSLLGITTTEVDEAIKKVIDALPTRIFEQVAKEKRDEIKMILAREFIFFQAQENKNRNAYENDLKNFIRIFTRDIERQY